MAALPSAGFSITVRVSVPADSTAIGRIATAVGDAGAIVTALDVVDSDHLRVIADVTCDTANMAHADHVVAELAKIDGLEVRKVSDRTFLLHLGGKIEVHPKVALRTRDELSRAYTPGVARVCLAIAENPDDAFLRYGVAMQCLREGDVEEGRLRLRSLIEDDPDGQIAAYQQLGQSYADSGEVAEAAATLRLGIAKARAAGDGHAAAEMEGLVDALG